MPRVFFTGRKKISKDEVSIVFRPGRPPEFSARIDLSKHRRTLPAGAKVVVEAYHNTMLQRFDFGTVADCRPRGELLLTNFDEWDRPRFRVRVVDLSSDLGAVLGACERIDAVYPDEASGGGRSLLKLLPRPESHMHGELWRIEPDGAGFQLAYNKDLSWLERSIKAREPQVLGLILPAALREILSRELLWGQVGSDETSEWIDLAQSISSQPPPSPSVDGEPIRDDVEDWINEVVACFCRDRARFVQRIRELTERPDETSSVQ
jgi:hypothetical protein